MNRPLRPEDATILVVDDHALNLELLKQDLGDVGYKVVTARSGREALTILPRSSPDLILLDIMMPEISGLEVLKRLRQASETRDIPVILVTAKSQSRDVVEGLRAGANDYVTKPVDVDILLARIETQLRMHALQEELERRNERIRRDLQEARRVQTALMPTEEALEAIARSYGVKLVGFNRAPELLGGDFWDLINLADGTLGLIITDFAGHGIIPALNTFRIKTFLHSSCAGISNVGLALARINAYLVNNLPRNDFATAIFAKYNADQRAISLANAGHPGPLLYRKSTAALEPLTEGGNPIGLFPDAEVVEATITLAPGDLLLLYTNGLINLPNHHGELFGLDRLQEAFLKSAAEGASTARDAILERINEFGGEVPLGDDITFILLEALD